MSQLDEKQSEVDSSDFSSMKVAELRDLLKEKNLSTQGRKAELITRLEESNNSNQTETKSNDEDENTNEESNELKQISSADQIVLNPTDKPLSVSETLGKYDENDDGKMDHFEFIDHHSDEVENKGLAGIFDRFLDDDPQMRGQRLWVMFSFH